MCRECLGKGHFYIPFAIIFSSGTPIENNFVFGSGESYIEKTLGVKKYILLGKETATQIHFLFCAFIFINSLKKWIIVARRVEDPVARPFMAGGNIKNAAR